MRRRDAVRVAQASETVAVQPPAVTVPIPAPPCLRRIPIPRPIPPGRQCGRRPATGHGAHPIGTGRQETYPPPSVRERPGEIPTPPRAGAPPPRRPRRGGGRAPPAPAAPPPAEGDRGAPPPFAFAYARVAGDPAVARAAAAGAPGRSRALLVATFRALRQDGVVHHADPGADSYVLVSRGRVLGPHAQSQRGSFRGEGVSRILRNVPGSRLVVVAEADAVS